MAPRRSALDPQARVDFAYNAYDQVTQVGKALVAALLPASAASHSYFVGCSEGGREAMLMTQRFPQHYDGVVAGDPVLHLPLGPLSGLYTTQAVRRAGARAAAADWPTAQPAIGKTYSDPDLLLMRNAVLGACDALDGLVDGIVDNLPACTHAARQRRSSPSCAAAAPRPTACLSADQIATMQMAFDGARRLAGTQLYSDWQWDAGISGLNGTSYNP